MLQENNPDIVIISETKLKRPVIPHLDVSTDNYDIIEIRSNMNGRGGLVALTKTGLQLELAKVIRTEEGNNFIHAVVLQNKKRESIVGWYNSPGTKRAVFYK